MLRNILHSYSTCITVCASAFALCGLSALSTSFAAPAPMPPKTVTVDLGDGVKMEFVLIPSGKFKMGSPKEEEGRLENEDQHEVQITRRFYLAKYLVTQEQYRAIMMKNPSHFKAGSLGAKDVKDLDTKQFPVEWVSWDDAQAFCKKLREKDKEERKFRLPTEAEWEYACRAGTTTPFYFGSELNGWQANCAGNIMPYGTVDKGPNKQRPTKVGDYGENKWGLCDMHGNVWQWCEDYYVPYDGLPEKDPLQSVKKNEFGRIARGGAWDQIAWGCRAARRCCFSPNDHQRDIGFRVAFTVD
jgi:formylglycine-generating enzyme required for sulfatase activity